MENKSVNDIITKVTSKTIGKEHNNKIENYLYFEEERIKNKIKKLHIYYNERNIYCFFPIFDITKNEIYHDRIISLINGPGLSYVTSYDLDYELGIDEEEIFFLSEEYLVSIKAHFNILKRCDLILIKTNLRDYKFGNMSILEKGRELEELFYEDKFITSFQTSYQLVHNKPILASISAIFDKVANKEKYLKKSKTFFFHEISRSRISLLNTYFNYLFSFSFIIFILLFYLFFLCQNLHSGEIFITDTENLKSNITIFTDDSGLVHLYSDSFEDSMFGLGYTHARDRLWQMELMRRMSKGRMSEIFGNSTLILDKNFKTMEISKYVNEFLKKINKSSRQFEILTMYTNGLNLFIRTHFLPLEFYYYNLNFEVWTVKDSISCLLLYQLLESFELRNELVYFTFDEILNKTVEEIHILRNLVQLNETTTLDLMRNIFNYKFMTYQDVLITKWNSMLTIQSNLLEYIPSFNYFVKIYIREKIIVGSTIAGIPAIIQGNNNFINWAFSKRKRPLNYYFCDENNDVTIKKVDKKILLYNDVKVNHSFYTTKNGPIIFNYSSINNFINEEKVFSFNLRSFQTNLLHSFLISLIELKDLIQITSLIKKSFNFPYTEFNFVTKTNNSGYSYVNFDKNYSFQCRGKESDFSKYDKEIVINYDSDYLYRNDSLSFRSRRFDFLISKHISNNKELTKNEVTNIINDVVDEYAIKMIRAILNIIDKNKKILQKSSIYRDLKNWDGQMDHNSYIPTIYSVLKYNLGYYFILNNEIYSNSLMKNQIFWIYFLEIIEKSSIQKVNHKSCNLDKISEKFNIHYINKFDCQRFFIKIFENLDRYLKVFKTSKYSIANWGDIQKRIIMHLPFNDYLTNSYSSDGNENTIAYSNHQNENLSFSSTYYTDMIYFVENKNMNKPMIYNFNGNSLNEISKYFNWSKGEKRILSRFEDYKLDRLCLKNTLNIKKLDRR